MNTPTLIFTASDSPPGVDSIAIDSDDGLTYLCPTLGPTATLLMHRLVRRCSTSQFIVGRRDLAMTFGLSDVSLAHAIDRLVKFRMLQRVGVVTEVDSFIVPVYKTPEARWTEALPAYLKGEWSDGSSNV